ncbi:MAG: flagellar motor protein, partial [Methylophaga sp.]|nr:flagellar motor protein [Methylophaga sp.]
MDILSILGLIVGFGAILVGQHLEGGHLDTILNAVAMLIVFGGTLGA